jgi:hypothetical protein
MSKASRKRSKDKRAQEKKARKMANYVRCGPKGTGGVKKQQQKTVGDTKKAPPKEMPAPKTSAKGRARRRKNGLQWKVKR